MAETIKEKKDDLGKSLKSIQKTVRLISFTTSIFIWLTTIGRVISKILASLLASAWMATLIMFIWKGDYFYLKVFCTVPIVGVIGYFQIYWLEAFLDYNEIKERDMSKKDYPDKNDLNLKIFSDQNLVKYKVIDKADPQYNQQLFLYSTYGRINDNKTFSFFKPSQVEEILVTEEKN